MLDSKLRPYKDRIVRPVVMALKSLNWKPNGVTWLAFWMGIAAASAVWRRQTPTALLLWITNRILDGADGSLARMTNTQTLYGSFVDIIADTTVYALLPISVVTSGPWHEDASVDTIKAWYSILSVLEATLFIRNTVQFSLSFLLERFKTGNPKTEKQAFMLVPPSLIEGSELAISFTAMVIFPQWFVPIASVMTIGIAVDAWQKYKWAGTVLSELIEMSTETKKKE